LDSDELRLHGARSRHHEGLDRNDGIRRAERTAVKQEGGERLAADSPIEPDQTGGRLIPHGRTNGARDLIHLPSNSDRIENRRTVLLHAREIQVSKRLDAEQTSKKPVLAEPRMQDVELLALLLGAADEKLAP
jgi:hypothetical protein